MRIIISRSQEGIRHVEFLLIRGLFLSFHFLELLFVMFSLVFAKREHDTILWILIIVFR